MPGAAPQLKLVARPCPICGAKGPDFTVYAEADFDVTLLDSAAFSSRKLPEYMHFRILQCSTCQVLYSSPAPEPLALSELYRSASFEAREKSKWAARTYARQVRALGIPLSSRVLDVGAGDGTFLEALLDLGFLEVQGIEPSGAPVAQASARVRPLLKQAEFKGSDFEAESLDLVTCFQTIEHVSEPLELAREVFRIYDPVVVS